MLGEKILNYFKDGGEVTSDILVEMKGLSFDDLIFILNSEQDINYILKCYLTVIDFKVFNRAYMEYPLLVEDKFADMWMSEVLNETNSNIVAAYIPLNIFDSNFIRVVRLGVKRNYDEKSLYNFDQKIISLLYYFDERGKENIISNLFCWGDKITNIEALNKIRKHDYDLYKKSEKIKNNIMFLLRFLSAYYDNVEKTRSISLRALKNDLNNVDNVLLANDILREDIVKEIFDELKINDVENIINNSELDEISRSLINDDENRMKTIDDLDLDSDIFDINKFKIKKAKKKTNFKIVLISIIIMVFSLFVAIQIIKSEIEKRSDVRNLSIDTSKSEIPIEVKYVDDTDKKKN